MAVGDDGVESPRSKEEGDAGDIDLGGDDNCDRFKLQLVDAVSEGGEQHVDGDEAIVLPKSDASVVEFLPTKSSLTRFIIFLLFNPFLNL